MIKIKPRQLLWDREVTATAVHKATGISQSICQTLSAEKEPMSGWTLLINCVFI